MEWNNAAADLQLIKSMKAALVKQAQQALKQCTGPGPSRLKAKATKKTITHKKQSHQATSASPGERHSQLVSCLQVGVLPATLPFKYWPDTSE